MPEAIGLDEIRAITEETRLLMPALYQDMYKRHCGRIAEEISWICKPGGTVVDLGGGVGFHAMICSLLGMNAYCVDFFRLRPSEVRTNDHRYEAEELATQRGVKFIHTDLLEWEPPFEEASIDAVMTLDNIEHLHHSPRQLYKAMVRCLKSGGDFLIGSPNAANILKRFRMLMGRNVFAKLDDWYELKCFVGHVREPIVSDLKFVGRDLGLHDIRIIGRNWLGYYKFGALVSIPDRVLRAFPSLCSDIYLIGKKSKM